MRKKPPEKHQNHERWLISYADFVTLLLATFVVMYAVSSINSSKFQEMAEAFSTAFMGKITQIQASGLAAGHKAPFDYMPSPVHTPIITRDVQEKNLPPALTQAVERRAEQLQNAYKKLLELLSGMIREGKVKVSLQSLGVVIDINTVLLFDSGKAVLTPQALDLVDQVAGVIKELHYPIQVNGFTDTRPVHTEQFDSNWDLSAERAMAVVKRLATDGIDPRTLVGAGYGEYHPIAPNDTPESMAMNRRVSIVIVSALESRKLEATPLLGDASPGTHPAAIIPPVGGTAPPVPGASPAPAAPFAAPSAAPPPAAAVAPGTVR
jgi:chemotaxis protein MotB